MKSVIVGDCSKDSVFQLEDASAFTEAEFECHCIEAISCVHPEYICIRFEAPFRYLERVWQPDLALISKRMTHWFVVEVELVSHSFDLHVLPQVKAFRYGDLDERAAASAIQRGSAIPISQALTIVRHLPRYVVTIANRPQIEWESILLSHDIQFLSVSTFRNESGIWAREVNGSLNASKECIGWGTYSVVDRSFRFPTTARIPSADTLQIRDPFGAIGVWAYQVVRETIWLTKTVGNMDLLEGQTVQLMRDHEGRLYFRVHGTPQES